MNMDRRTWGRIFSALILAAGLAYLLYQQELSEYMMGKEHYLNAQAAHYDVMLSTPPQLGYVVYSIFVGIGAFGIYELLAFGIYKVISWHSENQD